MYFSYLRRESSKYEDKGYGLDIEEATIVYELVVDMIDVAKATMLDTELDTKLDTAVAHLEAKSFVIVTL